MTSLFQSAAQARSYAQSRPTYPAALYQRLVTEVCGRRLVPSNKGQTQTCAVDLGCGTGQATVALADYFDRVIGMDPSPSQLAVAVRHSRVTYRVGTSHALRDIPDGSVDLVTSAQAAHWFEVPSFHAELRRVLKPAGGAVAIWMYGNLQLPQQPDLEERIMGDLYGGLLGDEYWDPRRKLVENHYEDLYLPSFAESDDNDTNSNVEALKQSTHRIHGDPSLDIVLADWPVESLRDYLRSWSGYVNYLQTHGIDVGSERDPIVDLEKWMTDRGYTDTVHAVFPVTLLWSRKGSGGGV